MSQEIQYSDYNVYADWKDENNVSDGAKILAEDIVDLDTCTKYDEADDWNDKIDLLDSDDTSYVENYEFEGADKKIYTIREKLDYMGSLSNKNDLNSLLFVIPSQEGSSIYACAVIATVVTLLLVLLVRGKIKRSI